MKISDQLSHEDARRDSYKLISACYHPPTRDLISTLGELQDRIRQICTEAVKFVRRMREQLKTIEDFDGLLIDYSRLFLGPYELLAPPYGSVYLEVGRRVMGDSTVDTRNRYRDAGVDISKDFCEAPDHIAAELEFMYFLIFKEIQALSNFDSELAIDFLKKQESFLEQHLTEWVAEFADNIEKNAKTEFYRNLGRCTSLFVLNDHRHLKKSFGSAISLHGASCEESKRNVI